MTLVNNMIINTNINNIYLWNHSSLCIGVTSLFIFALSSVQPYRCYVVTHHYSFKISGGKIHDKERVINHTRITWSLLYGGKFNDKDFSKKKKKLNDKEKVPSANVFLIVMMIDNKT